MNSSRDGSVSGVTVEDLRENAVRTDREALSALMDDEAGELEIRRLVRRLPEHPELLTTWKQYQLIKAVLHETTPVRANVDLLAGINAAIADEPVPARKSRFSGKLMRLAGQGAIAASVAAFALFGVSSLELAQRGGSDEQPQLVGEYNPSGYERTVRLDSAARTRLQQAVYQFSSTPRSAESLPEAAAAPLILELDLQQNREQSTPLNQQR
jgi:sigma-E factor negative regulatory protein RseA